MLSRIIRSGKVELYRFLNTTKERALVIPNDIEQLSGYTFSNKDGRDIDLVYIPDNIVEIPDHCFERSKVRHVRMSPNLKRIGECAFKNCVYLEDIFIPEGCMVGTKTYLGTVCGGDTVFEGCIRKRNKYHPWIDYGLNGKHAIVMYEGAGYLQITTNKKDWEIVEKGTGLWETDVEDGKEIWVRAVDDNTAPTSRCPGPYMVKTRTICIK